MKDFLLNAILYPFVAILFFLAFGVPFVYTGFQVVDVTGTKDPSGEVMVEFNRKHFWRLVHMTRRVVDVEGASLNTSRVRRTNSIGSSRRMVSGVFINTETESTRLFAGSSNIDDQVKWDAVNSINEFVSSEGQFTYSHTFKIHNIFGWVGLPFLIIGVLGVIGWPFSIIRYQGVSGD